LRALTGTRSGPDAAYIPAPRLAKYGDGCDQWLEDVGPPLNHHSADVIVVSAVTDHEQCGAIRPLSEKKLPASKPQSEAKMGLRFTYRLAFL